MRTYNNNLKKIIKRLPNDGNRSGWIRRTQNIIKKKKLQEVSNSLLYALVNDYAGLNTSNMYVVEVIIQATDELLNEYNKIKGLIEESVES